MDRDSWVSNVGFVLAAIGSAAGLGNIWRFPWLTADNGGSAFLVMYLLLVVGIGVPGLLAELVLGRRGRQTPIGALRSLIGSRWGTPLGAFNVITTVVMLSFYSVVGGWVLRYTLLPPQHVPLYLSGGRPGTIGEITENHQPGGDTTDHSSDAPSRTSRNPPS